METIKNMNDPIYLILILIFVIFALSRFIVLLYKSENTKAKSAILYFRMLLGFLIAMLIFSIIGILKGQDVVGKLFGK